MKLTQSPRTGARPSVRLCVGPELARCVHYCLTTASKNQVQPSLGCRQGGDFTKKTRHCPLTLSRTRHLPKISLLHQIESSSAVQQRYSSVFARSLTSVSNNQVQTSSGCRQGGRFHNKPRHFPRTLFPKRRLSKTPLLHQSESSSDARQRYGPVFVRS